MERRRRVNRVVHASLCCAVAGALFGSAAVAPASRGGRGGKVLLGVLGDPNRFAEQTMQRSRFRLVIMSWGQGESPQYFASLFATMQEVPMLGLSTGGGEGGGPEAITAGQIARGAGDQFLVALNQALAAWASRSTSGRWPR